MASFALIPIFSGFRFDLPEKSIGFSPVISGDFRCFFSVGTGYGVFERTDKKYVISLVSGYLRLNSVTLGGCENVSEVKADGKTVAFTQNGDKISFNEIKIEKNLAFSA